MARTFEELAKAQLVKAIKKTFPDPTPLIGEKWFKYHPEGQPADMEFTGTARLAKATGAPAKKVANNLIRNLELDKLGCEAQVAKNYDILLRRKVRPEGGARP